MAIKKKAGRISPVFMGDYDNSTIYRRLDWVYYGGTSYICKKNNTTGIAPSNIEKWQKIIELPTELNMIFEEAATRENIISGDKLSVVLGKIRKWFVDLKDIAFTGKYSDLEGTPGIVTKTENGLVQKGDGQANKVWKTDANGNPAWRDDENTQAVTSVNNKTGAITLSATDVKAIPVNNRIEKLTDIGQITGIGFWTISAIDSNYAASIGIDNNTGDFYALVLSYNGNNTNFFNFGTVILSSPRLSIYHYQIQVWEGAAQAVKTLNNQNILNTTEQISANTNNINLAGALALKAAIADYTNKFNTINSNLTWKYVGSIMGDGNIKLPKDFNILNIGAKVANEYLYYSFIISHTLLEGIPDTFAIFRQGFYDSDIDSGHIAIRIDMANTVSIHAAYQDGNNVKNITSLYVFAI